MKHYYNTLLIGALIALMSCGKENQNDQINNESFMKFYIGTYTSEEKPDIYSANLQKNGKITDLKALAHSGNPSFLALNTEKSLIYAANEYFDKNGDITIYKVDGDTLIQSDQISSEGLYPCYIDMVDDKSGVVANYGGSVSKFTANGKGSFSGKAIAVMHEGSSIDTARQKEPHPHTMAIHPNKKWVLATDLGTDEVIVYDLSDLSEINRMKTDPGAGPRHIAFRNENQAYVINELNSSITTITISPEGQLTKGNSISTLPQGYEGENYPADIHIHPNGKYLYASNRGHESIALFQINEDGSLKFIETFKSKISWPRNFAISPDGKFLVVANQKSNSIIVLEIMENTGRLSDVFSSVEVPTPTQILFVN